MQVPPAEERSSRNRRESDLAVCTQFSTSVDQLALICRPIKVPPDQGGTNQGATNQGATNQGATHPCSGHLPGNRVPVIAEKAILPAVPNSAPVSINPPR